MSQRIAKLLGAVQVMHACTAAHVQSVPVREMFGERVAWEGVVEVFALTGHAKAQRCYAWSYQEGGEPQYVTVLELPPVVSPQTAVRALIASQAKQAPEEWACARCKGRNTKIEQRQKPDADVPLIGGHAKSLRLPYHVLVCSDCGFEEPVDTKK